MLEVKRCLFWLVILTILLRLVPIFPDRFVFMFDHAKDSLIIMQMGQLLRPSLVGAVTSIPGVYYGPAWYYLALPLNMLLNYHPLASVLTVIFLAAAGTIIAWKYLGKLEAVMWATSFGIIGSQTSAWSPYLTPLIVLPILAILLKTKINKPLCRWGLLILVFLVSLSFHFQPAFAVILLPIVLIILILLKVKIPWKEALLALVVFVIPFTPHLIFELRHDFHQTKQLVNFFTNYEQEARVVQANAMGWQRVVEIGNFVLSEAGNSVSPVNIPFFYFGLAVSGVMIYQAIKFKKGKLKKFPLTKEELIVLLTFLIGTWLLYLVFPAKKYYLVAIMPVWLVLVARLITRLKPKLVNPLIHLIILLAIIQMIQSRFHFEHLAQTQAIFLAPKMQAIEKVYELSQGQPFASYHYLPELYDYPYQHLYRYFILKGYPAPVEYSYQQHEVAHVGIVAPLLTQAPVMDLPKQQFLIIERPTYDFIFQQWWGLVASPLNLADPIVINPGIKIYSGEMK